MSGSSSPPPEIDRAFLRLAEGLVHYRFAGDPAPAKRPLYMAHAGPVSSLWLAPLAAELARGRQVIAPDMPGNGDSSPPARPDTDIGYYADCALRTIDALGLEQIDFYGSHTGAMIGVEFARRNPARVGRLVLDGVVLMDPVERQRMLDNYAPAMKPDAHGGQFGWAYQFCRDMFLFYPYFDRDAAHRTGNGVPPPEVLHPFVVDVLKALTTYHCAYRAAFAYDMAAALAESRHDLLLVCAASDPTHADLPKAAALRPDAAVTLFQAGERPAQIARRIAAFLD
ncbi:pimeloyl-ACP methyl ester carboxylesterase [Sphingomonas zeicaulis]|uniref:alpha/beta hydrolase n=1 Tax=Sphingomonas zeicaulis TaxID=1632740 RepID=UPI003D256EDC